MSKSKATTVGDGVGQRLAERRRIKRLSGQDLAVQSGLSVDTVRSIESGRIPNPGILTVAKLAAVLDASLDELAGLSRGQGRSRGSR